MIILSLLGIAISKNYYGNINNSIDPRVKKAHLFYRSYNAYAFKNDAEMVLALLDSITDVFSAVPHYSNSYEMGVIHNNRASVFLTKALSDTLKEEIKQHYFTLAEQQLLKSIDYYTSWIKLFDNKTEEDIKDIVGKDFISDSSIKDNKNIEAFIRKRVKDILTALIETPRRLSVSYTNLGIIKRHAGQLEEAYNFYIKALDLWDENHIAKNNVNILFGELPEKQNFLRKLFPPERL